MVGSPAQARRRCPRVYPAGWTHLFALMLRASRHQTVDRVWPRSAAEPLVPKSQYWSWKLSPRRGRVNIARIEVLRLLQAA
jgi:hypothetical protein